MDNFIVLNMIIFIAIAFLLMAFAVFTIGFLIGYRMEDKKILKRKEADNNRCEESEKERNAKKEWKKFLEYDGSAPEGDNI